MRSGLFLALILAFILPNSIIAQYKIMVSNHYPPYNFIDENGSLTGFNVEILEAIIDLSKKDIRISSAEWDTINIALEKGEIDAIAGIHYPESPDTEFLYTRSLINTSHCFLYNTEKISHFTIEDFRSQKEPTIGVYKNDVLMYYILSINPSTHFLFFDNYEEMIQSLDKENVYCVFAKRVGGIYYARKYGKSNIGASEHRVLERSMGLKVSKNHPELAELINNGMEVILANGTYQKIYDKWIPSYDQTYIKWQKYVKAVIIAAIFIFLLTISLIFFNRVLRNQVVKKTNDLRNQLDLNSNMMKELEKQKNRAEESDKMKSAFLANMSHEIRTPMNGILGFAELLKTEDLSDEENEQFVNVIIRSGNRMLGTINNIIEVSKLESGVEDLQIQKTDVSSILAELKEFFTPEAQAKGLELIVEENNASDLDFFTDEYKLNSIFTNLIKNAIKFTKNGFVKVYLQLEKEQLKFSVIDSGVGIPIEKQKSIFDQFVQADFSHSNGYEGSGLGLSITKGYVDLLKGSIHMNSAPGKGTQFLVQIPNLKL
jgi:signal transduction histidine kinase